MKYKNQVIAIVLSFLLVFSIQQKANADPYIFGASICYVSGGGVYMYAVSWLDAGWYPEVQVIGHINTIIQSYAPYLQVFGPYISANTSVGTILYSPLFAAAALPGVYTLETLHGYIDDDGTAHESNTTIGGCII